MSHGATPILFPRLALLWFPCTRDYASGKFGGDLLTEPLEPMLDEYKHEFLPRRSECLSCPFMSAFENTLNTRRAS